MPQAILSPGSFFNTNRSSTRITSRSYQVEQLGCNLPVELATGNSTPQAN